MIVLAQLKCHNNHCITGFACDPDQSLEENKKAVAGLFESGMINPWCGICGSKTLTWDIKEVPFKNLEEAKPFLQQCQEDQMRTKAYMDFQGITEDSKTHKNN